MRYALDVGGSKDSTGKRKSKMNHKYKEKYFKGNELKAKRQRELYQSSPKTLTYEAESALNKEDIFKALYAGIDLFDRLIYEAKQELESKKLQYKAYKL